MRHRQSARPVAAPAAPLAVAALAIVASLCSASLGWGTGAGTPRVAQTRKIQGWIENICDFGVRRPGFPANTKAVEWSAKRLRKMGLGEVWLEPIQVSRWEETSCSVEIAGQRPASFDCFPLPFSTPTKGIEAEATLDFDGAGDELRGKVAVYRNVHTRLPLAWFRQVMATSAYDPGGELGTQVHVTPFSPRLTNVMLPAQRSGAAGFIGIAESAWGGREYYVPYDDGEWSIPGVWLSAADGHTLLERMRAGTVRVRLAYEASRTRVTSHNLLATLPGASDDWVVVGTHHDGPWASAVEDASGMALVLAQAHYWSQLPEEERPFNLLFLMNGGHMAGGAGLKAFVDDHRELLEKTVVAIHLEHVARDHAVVNGRLVPAEGVTPRWWFTTEIPRLQEAVLRVIEDHDLRRSFILRPDVFGEHPPTDGAFIHPHAPIVQLLAAPEYLFDRGDTVEMVHQESLVPITRAVIDLIHALAGESAESMRAGGSAEAIERQEEAAGSQD